MKPRGWISVIVAALVLVATTTAAEEACKPTKLAGAVSLGDMYKTAEAKAKAWKADAVPARLGNTSLGPLDAHGRSTAWNMLFYSPSADARFAISTFRGTLNCWADPGEAGRLPDLAPSFVRDGAKLYEIARKHAEHIAQGYGVAVQTAASPRDRHATWNLSFSKESGPDAGLIVIVDANTGAVEDTMRRGE